MCKIVLQIYNPRSVIVYKISFYEDDNVGIGDGSPNILRTFFLANTRRLGIS